MDANRAAATVMGEKDNKKALDRRRKEIVNEEKRNNRSGDMNDQPVLDWETYYNKVSSRELRCCHLKDTCTEKGSSICNLNFFITSRLE